MSTHLPVDPADPNRGGIPLRDDDGKWIGIVVDDPYVAGKLPPEIAARLRTLGARIADGSQASLRDLIQRLAPEPAELVMPPAPLTIPTRVHRDDHPSTRSPAETWPKHSIATDFAADFAARELWPGQHEHHRHHDLMMAEHATTGIYRDPVSGREFPPGGVMLRDPNREQRRRLAAWRASGKVRR